MKIWEILVRLVIADCCYMLFFEQRGNHCTICTGLSRPVVEFCVHVSGENWVAARRLPQSSLHLLNPLAVNVDVFQCMVEDAKLPR